MSVAPSVTLLISSAGRRVALMEAFRNDAREMGINLRIIATDLDPGWSAACASADAAFAVPSCSSPGFVPRLREICAAEKVSMVIPTIDPELQSLAEAREQFRSEGVRIVISDPAVVAIARDKQKTADFLAAHGIHAPKTAPVAEVLNKPGSWRWPILLKPISGSSSVGVQICENAKDLEAASKSRPDYLAQEYWQGREFTVNMFFDESGSLRCAIPHWRKERRAGEVSKGMTLREAALLKLARNLAAALKGARGPLCFQTILTDDNEAITFELNARFGGGFPLAHAAGGMFSKWLLEESLGRPSSAHDDWRDRTVMLRYDAATFLTM